MPSQTALAEICSCYVLSNPRKSQSAGAAPRRRLPAKNAEAIVTTRGITESNFFTQGLTPVQTATSYLDTLNPEQRRAVEHGAAGRAACAAAAGDRRRGIRQDQHARPSGRPSDRPGRRSAPHPADDVLASRRLRDDEAGRTHRPQGDGRQGRHHDRRAGLGRHLPRHRRAAAARLCRPDRPRSRRSRSTIARIPPT